MLPAGELGATRSRHAKSFIKVRPHALFRVHFSNLEILEKKIIVETELSLSWESVTRQNEIRNLVNYKISQVNHRIILALLFLELLIGIFFCVVGLFLHELTFDPKISNSPKMQILRKRY